jgi:UDP-N-acetylglucosamine 1-carboxyvinyltransferase
MAKTYIIKGGNALHGQVSVSGSRVAVTKIMIASLLSQDPVRIKNVPDIGEVQSTVTMLERVGTQITWDKENKFMHLTSPQLTSKKVRGEWFGKNRLPMLMVAPLLHRLGQAEISLDDSKDGVEKLINFHLDGYRKMGAQVEEKNDIIYFRSEKLKGATIELPYPSVSTTESLLLAAVLAEGKTVIKNVAVEPEVIDLTNLLQKMGAIIFHEPGRVFVIEGVGGLSGAEHEVPADRVETATLACAAVATQGSIFLRGAVQDENQTLLNIFKKIGAHFLVADDGIAFSHEGELRAVNVETGVHPGFITDWQPPFSVLMTQAVGASVLHETVHEQQVEYLENLKKMGANIQLFKECMGNNECRFKNKDIVHSAIINGPTKLKSVDLNILDARSGTACIIAALIAEGESKITGVELLERGYEKLAEKLISLGADITITGE